MECWGLSKHKSLLYWLLMLMMIHILMVLQTQGDCIEEERKALLGIKASYMTTYDSEVDDILPTWIDYDSNTPGDCCDWERVSCNTTTGHVIHLSLDRLRGLNVYMEDWSKSWPLNVSLLLHFKELRRLNLSHDFLDNEIMNRA
ncbi:hypothetical protein L1887_20019 [Cichorium endivia]|nr:hypothetical protein L1887_20019 [Cichorium endivia]